MAGLTREQRAARAAVQMTQEPHTEPIETAQVAPSESLTPVERPKTVQMVKDGQEATVNNNASVQIMQAAGWSLKD